MDVAVTAGVAQTTIHRFENADRFRLDTDRIVEAYARLLHVTGEDLWRAALERPDPPA
jgi:hypothetical protein